MSTIVVHFGYGDPLFDFADGFDIKNDIVRSYHSWAAALKCKIAGVLFVESKSLEVSTIICVVRSFQSISFCIGVLKQYKFKKIIFTYKDDLDRLSSDMLDIRFLNELRQLSRMSDLFVYSHKKIINYFQPFIECKSEYVPIGGAYKSLQHLFVPPVDRKGILVGQCCKRKNRCVPFSIGVACEVGRATKEKVTIVSDDVSFTNNYVTYDNVETVGLLPYYKWMQLLSSKKCVIDFDNCHTPGQILVDSAMLGVPCFGSSNDGGGINTYDDCEGDFLSISRKITYSYRVLCDDIRKKASNTLSLDAIKTLFDKIL